MKNYHVGLKTNQFGLTTYHIGLKKKHFGHKIYQVPFWANNLPTTYHLRLKTAKNMYGAHPLDVHDVENNLIAVGHRIPQRIVAPFPSCDDVRLHLSLAPQRAVDAVAFEHRVRGV